MTTESPATMGYRLLDVPVLVTVQDREAKLAVDAVLGGFPSHDLVVGAASYSLHRGDDGAWSATASGAEFHHVRELTGAVIAFESRLVSDVVASSREVLHLHGAALRTPSGDSSFLILGPAGSGKTTLALALMARGCLPYSDDVVFIDPETLAPRTFQRAFHVDVTSTALVGQDVVRSHFKTADLPPGYAIPLLWAAGPAPVRAVFFPVLRPADPPGAASLSMAAAASLLLTYSTTLDRDPEFALAMASRMTRQSACYELKSGGLAATAELVAGLIERRE